MTQIEVPVVSGPQKLSYPLFRLTSTDWAVLWVLICGTVILLNQWRFPGLLLGVLLICWVMWPLDWGRRYYVWFGKVDSWWIRVVLGGVLWENPYYDGDETLLTPKGFVRRTLRKIVYRKHPFPYYPDKLYDVGLGHNTYAGHTDSILVYGSGSSIATLGPNEAEARITQLEHEFRRIAAWHGLSAKVGTTVRRRPYSMLQFEEILGSEMHPDVLVPEALVIMQQPEHRGKSADELYRLGVLTREQLRYLRVHQITCVEARQDVAQNGADIDMIISVTIPRSARLQAAERKAKLLDVKEMRHERIVRLGESLLAAARRASVVDPRILDQEEWGTFLRKAWDAVDLAEYYDQMIHQTTEEATSTGNIEDESRRIPLWHPQIGIYATDKVAVFDHTNHAVLRITKMPREIAPDTMDGLFSSMPIRLLSRTLASEPVKGTREYYGLNFLSAIADSIMESTSLWFGTRTVRRRERLASEEERVANESHILYMNVFLGLVHEDPEELELLVEAVQSELAVYECQSERVTGETRVVRAALTAGTTIATL